MRTYRIIKTSWPCTNSPIATINGIFVDGSPSEVMSIAKKLQRKSQRNHERADYTVDPAICPDCECPVLEYGAGYCCQCEPE